MANFQKRKKKAYRRKTDCAEYECWVSEENMSFSINLENGEVSNVPGQQQMRKGKLKMRVRIWSYHSWCGED